MTMFSSAEHSNGTTAKAEEALRRKATQLQKFFDDVEELLGRVSDIEEEGISRLRDRVESSVQKMRSGAKAAVDGTRKAAVATNTYVYKKPWVAIGVGAAAGLLIGAMLRKSRD
jgi:ElaB protein